MAPVPTKLTVTSSARVSPTIHRLTFTADDISPFAASPHTDRYVKLEFPPGGGNDAPTSDTDAAPALRTYTVHSINPDDSSLAIDFALHVTDAGTSADLGVACAWATAAAPGDTITARGPGGAYSPDAAASRHLIAGDSTALPAIAAAVDSLADGSPADVIVETPDPADLAIVAERPGVGKRYVPTGDVPGEALADEVIRAIGELAESGADPATVQVFIHGEAHAVMKRIRPALKEAGFPVAGKSISGYWRHGRTEEAFRRWKRENRPDDA